MRKFLFIFTLLNMTFMPDVFAAAININTLTRVFSINFEKVHATGFTIERDNRQYLITAKHAISNMNKDGEVNVYIYNKYTKFAYKRIMLDDNKVDIAVLALDQQISPIYPVELGIKGIILSGDVYFLGFPQDIPIVGVEYFSGRPVPFVKKGIVARLNDDKNSEFYIDGVNVYGFSGGPVVSVDYSGKQKIFGVISGYIYHKERVMNNKNEQIEAFVKTNTGLAIAFPIDHALKAIDSNPIGPQISEDSENQSQ